MPGSVVDLSSFTFMNVLGEGLSGKVFLVRKKYGTDAGAIYALKQTRKDDLTDEHWRQLAFSELDVLKALVGLPFVTGLKYAFQSKRHVNLVMDFAAGGDLLVVLYRNGIRLREAWVQFYVAELVLAIDSLHQRKIVHRDIKTDNVFLDASGHVMLGDFGTARLFPPSDEHCRANTQHGSRWYMAPEMLREEDYTFVVDWYSLGSTAYDLATGKPANYIDDQDSTSQVRDRVAQGSPTMPDYLSPALADLLRRLLDSNPDTRLGSRGAREIMDHRFFRGINWEDLAGKQVTPPFEPKLTGEADLSSFDEDTVSQPVEVSPEGDPQSMELFRDFHYTAASEGTSPQPGMTSPVHDCDLPPPPRRQRTRSPPPVLERYSTSAVIDSYSTSHSCGSYSTSPALERYSTSTVIDSYSTLHTIEGYSASQALGSYSSSPAPENYFKYFKSPALSSYPKPPGLGSYSKPPGPDSYSKPHGLGSYSKPQAPGSYPKPPGAASYPKPPGLGSHSKPPGLGSYSKPPGLSSYSKPQAPGSYPKPPGLGSYSKPPGLGSYPKPPGLGSYSKPPGLGSYSKPQAPGSYPKPPGLGSYSRPPGLGSYSERPGLELQPYRPILEVPRSPSLVPGGGQGWGVFPPNQRRHDGGLPRVVPPWGFEPQSSRQPVAPTPAAPGRRGVKRKNTLL